MGRLDDDTLVAVKRLNKGTENERINNFLAEVGIVSHMNHPNIAKLVGVCVEGGEHLVLELSPLGSLSNILHGNSISCIIYLLSVFVQGGLYLLLLLSKFSHDSATTPHIHANM